MTSTRYPVTPQHPPRGIAVWVEWDGRAPFVAARVAHPQTRAPAWITHDHGRAVLLPCRQPPPDQSRPWAGWHTLKGSEPDAWWPQNAARWAVPLPDPLPDGLPAAEGRMSYAKQAFSATEAAAEMEREREEARNRTEAAEPPEKQWWLDPHAVTYGQPGSISPREAEGRLMRAFLTEWWVRVERPSQMTFGTILANLARTIPPTAAELAAMDLPPIRIEPSGRDRDDMLIALGWLPPRTVIPGYQPLASPTERLLRLRGGTPPLSWRSIAQITGASRETARRHYAEALGEITAVANGATTRGQRHRAAQLADVQDANRRHRRGE